MLYSRGPNTVIGLGSSVVPGAGICTCSDVFSGKASVVENAFLFVLPGIAIQLLECYFVGKAQRMPISSFFE
jgi:hypothetical protein